MIYAISSIGGFYRGNKLPREVKKITSEGRDELIREGISPESVQPIPVVWEQVTEDVYKSSAVDKAQKEMDDNKFSVLCMIVKRNLGDEITVEDIESIDRFNKFAKVKGLTIAESKTKVPAGNGLYGTSGLKSNTPLHKVLGWFYESADSWTTDGVKLTQNETQR